MTIAEPCDTDLPLDLRQLRWHRRDQVRRFGFRAAKRALSWANVGVRRQAACGLGRADQVGIAWSTTLDQCFPGTGVQTCGSVWSCPVCSGKVRHRRTMEVQTVAQWHTGRGGTLVMATLTLRHTRDDALDVMVRALSAAYRRIQQSRVWRRDVRPFLDGTVRALEVTHGWLSDTGNGWHPHLHVLLLVSGSADQASVLAAISDVFADQWADRIVAELGERYRPDDAVGVDVRSIGANAAAYVAKISAEVTRGDLKAGGRDVWSLIDAGLWHRFDEYAAAMSGKRAVQFSRGLRAAAGLDPELTDEDIALDLEDGLIVAYFDRRTWNRAVFGHYALDLLRSLEVRCRAVRAHPPDS